jgi:phosphohistidine phosphatase
MEIYLLRHGIAEDGKPGRPDFERALTEEGREKLKKVLKRARSAGVEPTVILSSPYRRAMETAEAAAGELGYEGKIVRVNALVPEGAPAEVWEEVRSRRGEEAVLLASHEPLMSSMAAFLLESPALQVDMKKAAMVRIDCDSAGPHPRGVLKWMLTPALAD